MGKPTYKHKLNRLLGLPSEHTHTLGSLHRMTGVDRRILQKVYNKGIGAYRTNPRSVRTRGTYRKNQNLPMTQKLGSQQWAMARVYAFLAKLREGTLNHDFEFANRVSVLRWVQRED